MAREKTTTSKTGGRQRRSKGKDEEDEEMEEPDHDRKTGIKTTQTSKTRPQCNQNYGYYYTNPLPQNVSNGCEWSSCLVSFLSCLACLVLSCSVLCSLVLFRPALSLFVSLSCLILSINLSYYIVSRAETAVQWLSLKYPPPACASSASSRS
jgi:hypothetical protein